MVFAIFTGFKKHINKTASLFVQLDTQTLSRALNDQLRRYLAPILLLRVLSRHKLDGLSEEVWKKLEHMRMKATIISHESLPDGHDEIHRFRFVLQEGATTPPVVETISLRTARAIVSHLEDGNAFISMLRAIVVADPSGYGALVNTSYVDQFVMDGPGDRSPEVGMGFQNAHSPGPTEVKTGEEPPLLDGVSPGSP